MSLRRTLTVFAELAADLPLESKAWWSWTGDLVASPSELAATACIPLAEAKVRYVRTEAGRRKFRQAIGTPIRSHRGLPEVRMPHAQGVWGASHSGSTVMTGESAAIMGIPGYRQYREGDDHHHFAQGAALQLLKTIGSQTQLTRQRRFHGTSGRQWANVGVGDTFDLPLTATDVDTSVVGYGERGHRDNPDAPPSYLIVFPKGIPAAGITETRDIDTNEPTGGWDEMVVAGRFRVVRRHDVSEGRGRYTRIEVEPVALFDPVHRDWRSYRRSPRADPLRPTHDALVAELRDYGATVHDDDTVSVWPIPNLNRYSKEERPVDWTTNRAIAAERAEWANEPVPDERRVPLADVTVLDVYNDEARLGFPGDLSEEKGLEVKDVVRTPEGAEFYGQPIGSVIQRDAPDWMWEPGQWTLVEYDELLAERVSQAMPDYIGDQSWEQVEAEITEYVSRDLPRDSRVLVNGDVTIMYSAGEVSPTGARKLALEVDRLQGRSRVEHGTVMVQEHLSQPGRLAEATRGGSIIFIRPGVIRSHELEMERTAMPSSTTVSPLRYVLTHEWGHLVDQNNFREADRMLRVVSTMYDDLGGYMKTDGYEAFAEAWAEWVLTEGQTKNEATIHYAERYHW